MYKNSVTIHPNLSVRYYEFYLQGLRALYGDRLSFQRKGPYAPPNPKAGLAAVTPEGIRLYIAADDMPEVDMGALAWCHVYGKVNLAHEALGLDPRLIPIGPSFGIPMDDRRSLMGTVLSTSLRWEPRHTAARLRDYWRFQSSRTHLSAYAPSASDRDFLFLLASYWAKHPEVNPPRLRLLEAASEMPGLVVEGGFWGGQELPAEFRRFALSAPIDHQHYLELTGRSVAALNTSAVHDCLGWKLGEYFALGKAIVTPPLSRAMPGDLEHGRQIHVIGGSPEEAVDAIARLRADEEYRARLESGARRYWEEYLAPKSVVRRLVAHGKRL